MRPSEFEAIRPNLQAAVDAINADFEKTRQLREIAKELEGEFNWQAAVPEGAPSKDEAKDAPRSYSYMGEPARSCPLIEWAYPWRHSAERAARDLYDCGWTKEAEAITEVLDKLPTGPSDGNEPAVRKQQLDAIRTAAERVRTILVQYPIQRLTPSTTGFLGGAALADAMGIHPTRRDAFFRQLERQRMSLGDDCWHEVREPRPNSPRFLYRVDSPELLDLATAYKTPKPA